MSFKDRKRDDHGHVIGNDEVDGQECKHVNGSSNKQNAFDDDYEEEFNEPDEEYNREMKKAQEENVRKSLDLQDAINLADDDVLDEEFGEDTPERKLAGAIKEQPMSKKDDEVVQKVNAMKDEFYGIEPDEAERIVKDLDDKFEREERVNNNAKKFLDLMKNNKKDEAWNFLKTLSNEDVSYMFEKIRRDKK